MPERPPVDLELLSVEKQPDYWRERAADLEQQLAQARQERDAERIAGEQHCADAVALARQVADLERRLADSETRYQKAAYRTGVMNDAYAESVKETYRLREQLADSFLIIGLGEAQAQNTPHTPHCREHPTAPLVCGGHAQKNLEQAVAAERERCAKIADAAAIKNREMGVKPWTTAAVACECVAAAIRQGGGE